jgi:arsenite methyltransferase
MLKTTQTRRVDAGRAFTILSSVLLPFVAGCSVASRLDYGNLFNRSGWQHTDRVVEALGIRLGDTVADLGAGDGYFSFAFADAVGPTGRVYAVEIDPEKRADLREEIRSRGYENILLTSATTADSGLPPDAVDLAFFCNAYHHFEERVHYMRHLRGTLRSDGRIAILDGRNDPGARLFIPKGHWLEPGQLTGELASAGYRHEEEYDFLPMQTFDVFRVASAN